MRSNPAYGEVYSIQFYGIKFVGDLRQFGRWFSAGTPISSTNEVKQKRYKFPGHLILVSFFPLFLCVFFGRGGNFILELLLMVVDNNKYYYTSKILN